MAEMHYATCSTRVSLPVLPSCDSVKFFIFFFCATFWDNNYVKRNKNASVTYFLYKINFEIILLKFLKHYFYRYVKRFIFKIFINTSQTLFIEYLLKGLMGQLKCLVAIQTTLLSWYCRRSFRCADTWSVNRFEAASVRALKLANSDCAIPEL